MELFLKICVLIYRSIFLPFIEMSKRLIIIFFTAIALYGCNANFNKPIDTKIQNNQSLQTDFNVKKFTTSNGKVGYEITENNSFIFSQNQKNQKLKTLNQKDVESLNKILFDIEKATQIENKLQKITDNKIVKNSSINNALKKFINPTHKYISGLKVTP